MSDTPSPINVDLNLTKPVTVLIEKIASGAGVLYEPRKIRNKAKAEADAQVIVSKGKIKATQLEQRAMQRMLKEESKKQANMEKVIEKALPQLNENSNPDSVEDDWLAHFFEKSRNTSNEDLQNLWSRILAGEANSPGTYSKRTLSLLAEIDKKDAEIFSKLANYVWFIGGRRIPLVLEANHNMYTKSGINFDALEHLESLGLINFNSLAGYSLTFSGTGSSTVMLSYGHKMYTAQVTSGNSLSTGKVSLTQQGLELLTVCTIEEIDGFSDYIQKHYEAEGKPLTTVGT